MLEATIGRNDVANDTWRLPHQSIVAMLSHITARLLHLAGHADAMADPSVHGSTTDQGEENAIELETSAALVDSALMHILARLQARPEGVRATPYLAFVGPHLLALLDPRLPLDSHARQTVLQIVSTAVEVADPALSCSSTEETATESERYKLFQTISGCVWPTLMRLLEVYFPSRYARRPL